MIFLMFMYIFFRPFFLLAVIFGVRSDTTPGSYVQTTYSETFYVKLRAEGENRVGEMDFTFDKFTCTFHVLLTKKEAKAYLVTSTKRAEVDFLLFGLQSQKIEHLGTVGVGKGPRHVIKSDVASFPAGHIIDANVTDMAGEILQVPSFSNSSLGSFNFITYPRIPEECLKPGKECGMGFTIKIITKPPPPPSKN